MLAATLALASGGYLIFSIVQGTHYKTIAAVVLFVIGTIWLWEDLTGWTEAPADSE